MIRVALAALLAAALLGVTMPVIGDARSSATDRTLGADLARVGNAAESLAARHDAVRPEAGPARLTVGLVVPERDWGRAPATVTVGGDPAGDSLAWQVGDGPRRSVGVGVELRVWRAGGPVDGSLRLGPGRHRLVLSLVRVDGSQVVAVRGFKSDTGRTSPRVRVGHRRRGDRGGRGDGNGSV
ncbi:MAG: hypothetical protein V5A40_04175 [Haloarculaceae archaeon]